jgi:hypothetical protein
MAPDKIYVREYPDGLNQFWDKKKRDDVVATIHHEYIRKDALLEWLQKEYETISWYNEKMQHVTGCVGNTDSSGKAEAYKKVIDKLNSM